MCRYSMLCALLLLLVPMTAPAEPPTPAPGAAPRPLRIVLIGASIARGWQLDAFAARTGRSDVVVEYVGEYGFDKSKSLAAVLARTENRPDVVILKECGAYFPGDQPAYEAMIRRWVEALRAAGVVPVVATVAPVAAPQGVVAHLKEFVKTWILRREDQNAAIARYNDRLRAYAAEQELLVLDLETALSAAGGQRCLDPAYDRGDGLHLNEKAYPKLDRELGRLIDRLERPASR
jgi:hypothetical protein